MLLAEGAEEAPEVDAEVFALVAVQRVLGSEPGPVGARVTAHKHCREETHQHAG